MRATVITIFALLLTADVGGGGLLMIVAPAAPGGGWDQTARALQHAFAVVEPDASVQVENVAGAAGTIGLARFVTAERGNPNALLITGLVMVSAITTNQAPVSLSETTPIARLTGEPEVIVVPAASSTRTFAELLATFKASPSSVAWGGGSAGGTDDLLIRLIAEAIGVPPARVNYIAFPGGGAALAALLGGQVTAGVSGYGEFAGQIEAGALRALAVSSSTRVGGVEVPTLREQGVDLDLSNWRGIVAPPGLTDAERQALTARIERLAASEAWRAILARNGWEDMLLTGHAFRQFLLAEQSRITNVLQRLNADAATPATGRLVLTTGTAPAAILIGLVLLMATLGWQSLRTQKRAIDPTPSAFARSFGGPPEPWRRRFGNARALTLVAALSVHAFAFPVVGFIPASTVLFVVATSLFGSRHRLRDAAIGFATATLLYVVFTAGLGLTLPIDPLTRWLRG